jgi:Restriction endonuclease fold toxin 9
MKPPHTRRFLPAAWFVLAASLVTAFGSSARSKDLSFHDFESLAQTWIAEAQKIYRFDEDALSLIWEAYCGQLDPVNGSEDRTAEQSKAEAFEIGSQLQLNESHQIDNILERLASVRYESNAVKKTAERPSDVDDILEKLKKEEEKLKKLSDGVVLKGSNHPSVQEAIAYGIQAHKDMCNDFKGKASACDAEFPTLSGKRPDLVTVNSNGLVIYEFKPDNSKAKSMGERQVAGYVKGVAAYYQKFFPNGRTLETNGEPDRDFGGSDMLKALKEEPRAWESDDKTLKIQTEVKTYRMCDKNRFQP